MRSLNSVLSIDASYSTAEQSSSKAKAQHYGILLGSLAVFISVVAAALTFPFLQSQRDSLGCDALCYGSMQSARSGLSLVGAFLIGRLSDHFGRINILWLGLFSSLLSYLLNWNGTSITEMWLALIPSSLLNQNYNVLRALFADYNTESGGSDKDRASAMGRLGMAVGVAFMLGPVLATTFLKDYSQATATAFGLTVCSGIFIALLPTPRIRPAVVGDKNKDPPKESMSLMSFWSLPAAQSTGARLLFFMRLLMTLAFSIFMTVWTVSLKARFNFGPKDHAYFMGWIGLWYALSQGVIARQILHFTGDDSTSILLVCVSWLGLGRVIVMWTPYLSVVYAVMAVVIVSLGVVNTLISSSCSKLAGTDQVGGLFGVLEAMEGAGGLVGPTLGGLLHRLGPKYVLATVVLLYVVVFIAVFYLYRPHVVLHRGPVLGGLAVDPAGSDSKGTSLNTGASVVKAKVKLS